MYLLCSLSLSLSLFISICSHSIYIWFRMTLFDTRNQFPFRIDRILFCCLGSVETVPAITQHIMKQIDRTWVEHGKFHSPGCFDARNTNKASTCTHTYTQTHEKCWKAGNGIDNHITSVFALFIIFVFFCCQIVEEKECIIALCWLSVNVCCRDFFCTFLCFLKRNQRNLVIYYTLIPNLKNSWAYQIDCYFFVVFSFAIL